MLTYLQIRDLAIIDAIELEFKPGLTVLTGETGAGKSIVVDALQLVAGGRAGAEVVRHGAERAEISATFDLTNAARELIRWLDEQSIGSAERELAIRRVVASDGRSRAYLNGRAVAIQQLREVGNWLIDIHGQHEFQSLTRPAPQRELLDRFGRLDSLTEQVGIAHRVWLTLLNRTLELETKASDRDARLALLRYQVQELEALALTEGELTSLAEERARLANHGRLAESAQQAVQQLFEAEGSAHANASRALAALKGLADIDAKLATITPLIDSAVIQIGEAARELTRYLEGLEIDSTRQDQLERRLAAIEELARKHRVAPAQLLQRSRELTAELAAIETAETDLASLRKDLAGALESYRTTAGQLSARRQTAARALGKEITNHMQQLGMSGGRFQVEVTPLASAEPAEHGIDQVEFRVTANPGQPLRPLAKVASGGELSRLALAVQVTCAASELRCMVFDEVDAGIGGAVAEIVGRELRALGADEQVLCVTHLPQVASQGHQHLRVSKLTDGRTTRTTAAALQPDERIEELARMLGGVEVTGKARDHAREMLKRAATEPTSSSEKRSSGARSARKE